jgi:hypothetical protein
VTRSQQTSFPFVMPSPRKKASSPRVARRAAPLQVAQVASIAQPLDLEELERQRLERRIAAHLRGARLALAVTDNRHTMISVRRQKGLYRLRVHRMFLDASEDMVHALARYVDSNDREASQHLGQYIDRNQHRIRRTRRSSNPITIETVGEVFHLQEIFDDLNRRYFDGQIQARITWGQRPPKDAKRRRHNSIKMGSYSVEDKLIRIHPSLDRPFVPRSFIEWIVFHEMLHQKHPIPIIGGRRRFHTPQFLREEATFEYYENSRRWEQENLNRLLVY